MSDRNQKLEESEKFRAFVRANGIDVDLDSFEQKAPPAPDIICRLAGALVGFELTYATEGAIEQVYGEAVSRNEDVVHVRWMGTASELVETAVLKKLTKSYEHEGQLQLLVLCGRTVELACRQLWKPISEMIAPRGMSDIIFQRIRVLDWNGLDLDWPQV